MKDEYYLIGIKKKKIFLSVETFRKKNWWSFLSMSRTNKNSVRISSFINGKKILFILKKIKNFFFFIYSFIHHTKKITTPLYHIHNKTYLWHDFFVYDSVLSQMIEHKKKMMKIWSEIYFDLLVRFCLRIYRATI